MLTKEMLRFALLGTGHALVVAALLGIVVKGRYRRCFTFPLYLLAVLIADLAAYTEAGGTRQFWVITEAIQGVLKFAIVVELTIRAFRLFPGARATARNLLSVILVATFVAVASVPVQGVEEPSAASADLSDPVYYALAGQVLPRLLNGTVWLFAAVAVLILWYRLPVHPFHKSILLGFVPYLLVFTTLLNLLRTTDWRYLEWVNIAAPLAYVGVLLYWTYAAWAPERAPFRPRTAQTALRESA